MVSEVDRLRAEVAKRKRAVGQKASRLKRQHGVQIAGSEFDPRRAPGVEKRYNAAQLRTYLKQMNEFTNRREQFVAGGKGVPIPRTLWRQYQNREQRLNAVGSAYIESIENVYVEPAGMDIGGVIAARHPRAQGAHAKGPYDIGNRESEQFTSAGAVKKMVADLERRLAPNYLTKQIANGRQNLKEAFKHLGENEYSDRIDELSDYQFDLLWFGTNVAGAAFLQYDLEKSRAGGSPKESWQDRVIASSLNDVGEFLDWAQLQPVERPTNSSKTTPKNSGNRSRGR